MHLHPHHSPMLYMKPQKDNSTRLRVSCAATFYSRQVFVFLSPLLPAAGSGGSMLPRHLSSMFLTNIRKREQGLICILGDSQETRMRGLTAQFPKFLMSFSHLWSLEPMGPACPAAIRCLFCRNAGSHSSPGHYFPLHAPVEPLKAEDAHAPSPPVPVPANPTPALQAEETQPRLPQTSTKSLGLFSLGSTAQSCRPVPGVIYRNKNWPTHAHAEKTSAWTCNTQTIIS